jgi:hypothetical protein
LLYSPSVFQDLCAITWYWQLTGIQKKSVPNNLLKRFIKTTLSYSFRQKCDCVMLYCIETVREVNLAERHNHRIWQAMPVSTSNGGSWAVSFLTSQFRGYAEPREHSMSSFPHYVTTGCQIPTSGQL